MLLSQVIRSLKTAKSALLLALALELFWHPIPAQAQEPGTTRQELLKQQRIAKAQKLQDEQRGGLEKAALYIQKEKVLERLSQGWKGFHPVFGGLATGSGIAGGLRFAPNLLDGDLEFEVLGAISTRTYQLYELRLGAPRLGNGRFFADFYGNYRSGNRLPFFGLGPDSSNQNRTSFSAEPSIYDVTAGVNWTRWLSTGVRAGYLRTNTGPGKDPRFPSTEDVFTPEQAPALEVQPHFYHMDAFLTVDYLDSIGNPMAGGAYQLNYSYFDDQKVGLHTFRRLEANAQQYIPFLNKKRVIALRARTSLSDTSPGQSIPFYMQEPLGGAESLRGFREYRFRDQNLLLFNAEYRWEAFSGLDLAIFGDAGKVAPRRSDIDFSNLKTSAGFGFRFNTFRSVFLRVDVGFSNEGTRIFFKFGPAFLMKEGDAPPGWRAHNRRKEQKLLGK